ncbi:hypothetical protein B0H13DRAFT_1851068 [Mycena leptocephala]|nr:hypothetical protein B0H13DRAFT_1851068 [Mycena leptocephala]
MVCRVVKLASVLLGHFSEEASLSRGIIRGGKIGPTVNDWFSRQGHLSEAPQIVLWKLTSVRATAEQNGLRGGTIGLSCGELMNSCLGYFSKAASLSRGILRVAPNRFKLISVQGPAELNGLQGGEIGLSLSDCLMNGSLDHFSEAASLANGILRVASLQLFYGH